MTPVPACRCGYLPCAIDHETAINALWQHIEEAHGDAMRCGECGGALVSHVCVDCDTRHGPGVTRCWQDGDGSTCLLPDGHDGPHEFIPDSDISLVFPEEPPDGR